MRIVGLTRGISSGKSTVFNIFKAHGVPDVDVDVFARDVLKKGTGGWKKVVEDFGEDILLPNGEVDRPKLGQIVFSDPANYQLLNRLLATYISSGIYWEDLEIVDEGCMVIILDVPLLFEAKMDKWMNEEDARNRINAQMELDLKMSKADIVIDNTGSLEDLSEQFQRALYQVTRPLTCNELLLSRQAFWPLFLSL